MSDEHSFLLQRVQPAMVGLIDGSLSTLAPIFSVAIVSHKPLYAFAAGLATSIGAAISMAFSEGLSDTGELTGRGSPLMRGAITGVGTFLGGILHTLPFLWTELPRARSSPPSSWSRSSSSRWRGSAGGSSGRASSSHSDWSARRGRDRHRRRLVGAGV